MPVSLDVLIGFSVVMLTFSLTATAFIQAVLSLTQARGWNLLFGLRSLLLQVDPGLDRKVARDIAWAVVRHPLVSRNRLQLGNVIRREELVQMLMGFAAATEPRALDKSAREALQRLLRSRGIEDPGQVLRNVRATAMQLEVQQPALASHLRQAQAVIEEAGSEFVAGVNAWFDSTMDRVSQTFGSHVRIVTVAIALMLAFGTQLDTFELLNRLSLDKELRAMLVAQGTEIVARSETDGDSNIANPRVGERVQELRSLAAGKLISLPNEGGGWFRKLERGKSMLGVLLSAVLIGLGAPFWFNALKTLLSLRSSIAEKEDAQRKTRSDQSSPPRPAPAASARTAGGEMGDLPAAAG